jgi:hypothetical protein
MSRTISNERVRERFLALAEVHGREGLAEHIALCLGWNDDGRGRRQEPHQYRRGVYVQLGILENRESQLLDRIPAHRARQIHAELDRIEAGGPLEREKLVVSKPTHVAARAIA